MPMLSYVYQLFSAEQCQGYIHALRWKDRPLQCGFPIGMEQLSNMFDNCSYGTYKIM
jgi:hypothetical protein